MSKRPQDFFHKIYVVKMGFAGPHVASVTPRQTYSAKFKATHQATPQLARLLLHVSRSLAKEGLEG